MKETLHRAIDDPIYVLIVGQVRNHAALVRTLKTIGEEVSNGRITGCVWVIDYELNPELENLTRQYVWLDLICIPEVGDEFVAKFDPDFLSRDPGPRGSTGGMRRGTMFRQFRSFRFGLDAIPQKSWVLKTRADVELNHHFLKAVASLRAKLVADGAEAGSKIWVQWASARHPLYVQDNTFFGHFESLTKLVTRDFNMNLRDFYPTTPLPPLWWMNLAIAERAWQLFFLESRRLFLEQGDTTPRLPTRSEIAMWRSFARKNFMVRRIRGIKWYLQWNPGKGKKRIWIPLRRVFPAPLVFKSHPLVESLFARLGHAVPHAAETSKTLDFFLSQGLRISSQSPLSVFDSKE